ncbi:MAG: hypothetical protein AAGD38_11110 [Acidobacteriota bacterium]
MAQDEDPIIDGVIAMLGAEVPESVIQNWLDTTRTLPRRPTPQDVIALKEAGASEALMQQVIELSSKAMPPVAVAPPQAAPQAAPTGIETVVVPPPGTTPPTTTTTPSTPGDPEDTEVLVRFELEYVPFIDDEQDEEPWPMFVYVDGKPLSVVTPGAHVALGSGGSGLRFQRKLEVGHHIIHVTLERHQEEDGRWTHETIVAGETFGFELEPGITADVKLTFREPMFAVAQGFRGPIDFRFLQGDQVLSRSDVGGRPDQWRELCEDIEANIQGGEMSRSQRNALLRCVRWDTLWAGVEAPPRSEVLEYLELFDFKPVPRNVL